MPSLAEFAELVRAPAALSVPGDAVAGAAAAGTLDRRTAGLATASVLLYWAGMAGNDWADRVQDAAHRPGRPIPSGRVSAGAALDVAAGLGAAGLAAAAVCGGRRGLAVAFPLAAAVGAYDLVLKDSPAGPAGMALCRGLDVLLGSSTGRWRRGLRPALIVAAHTYAVTALSRREVSGARQSLPIATMAVTGAVAAGAAAPVRGRRTSVLPALLGGWYAVRFGAAQRAVLADPAAAQVRAAVSAGITSLPMLQGALAAGHAARAAGLAVAAAAPVGRRLARVVSPT